VATAPGVEVHPTYEGIKPPGRQMVSIAAFGVVLGRSQAVHLSRRSSVSRLCS
jgi:hypothetical protein